LKAPRVSLVGHPVLDVVDDETVVLA
jgi:hypothetical protein